MYKIYFSFIWVIQTILVLFSVTPSIQKEAHCVMNYAHTRVETYNQLALQLNLVFRPDQLSYVVFLTWSFISCGLSIMLWSNNVVNIPTYMKSNQINENTCIDIRVFIYLDLYSSNIRNVHISILTNNTTYNNNHNTFIKSNRCGDGNINNFNSNNDD